MSCVCNKRQLEITYNSIKHEKEGGFNNYYQILQYIYTQYPELRCHALTLYYKSSAISPDQYLTIYSHDPSLEIKIEKSQSNQDFNMAVFKLRISENDLLS